MVAPYTTGGEVLKTIKAKETENHQDKQIRLYILGMAEVTSESNFRRSSPCKGDKCCRTPGFPCKKDVGGNCWREGVGYTLWCQECREEVVAYLGETGRNAYTRGAEHLKSLKATS